MTDDKGAGEAYKQEYGDMEPDHPCVPDVWKNGFIAGRKAERERCAKIAEGYFNARGRVVAKAIMGGHDAE